LRWSLGFELQPHVLTGFKKQNGAMRDSAAKPPPAMQNSQCQHFVA
jgi:hypothetical protein